MEVKAALESSARTSAAKGVCRHRAVSGAGTELLRRRSGAAPRNGASRANRRPQNTRAGLVVRKSDDLCAAVRVTCEGRFSPWAPSCALRSRHGRVRSAFSQHFGVRIRNDSIGNIQALSTNGSNQISCWKLVCCSIRVSARLRRISMLFGETTWTQRVLQFLTRFVRVIRRSCCLIHETVGGFRVVASAEAYPSTTATSACRSGSGIVKKSGL